MRKLKLFLEFVSGNTRSAFLTDLTYEDISKRLSCSIDDIEEFEEHLKASINPSQTFHGSISGDESTIFDNIESEDQYLEMWKRFKTPSDPSHSHSDDRL